MAAIRPGLGVKGMNAQSYPASYVQECFAVWYKNERPSMTALVDLIPLCETTNTRPNAITLGSWRKTYDWDVQADIVDNQAVTKFQDNLATERAEMLQRHASTAVDIQTKALEYLSAHDFESTSVAIKALQLGIETERASRGLRGGVVNVFNMGDDQITKELESLLERLSSKDTVIDGVVEDVEIGVQKE